MMNGSEISAMQTTARALVANEKGILAADESLPTIGRRFAAVGIESTEENRRAYREMLFTAPHIEEFISGVILFDETIRQKNQDYWEGYADGKAGRLPADKKAEVGK